MASQSWFVRYTLLILALLALVSVTGLYYVLWKVVCDVHRHIPSYGLTTGSVFALRTIFVGHSLILLFWFVTRKCIEPYQISFVILAYTVILLAALLFGVATQIITILPVI